LDRKGFELPAKTLTNPAFPTQDGAKSGARATNDPELARIIEAWPTLSPDVRNVIRRLIDVEQAGK
jgi:hypothetical protein